MDGEDRRRPVEIAGARYYGTFWNTLPPSAAWTYSSGPLA